MRKAMALHAAILLLLVAGCSGVPHQQPTDLTGAPDQARILASEVASAVVAGDAATLYRLMPPALRETTSFETAKPTIDRIVNYGGKPVSAAFKQQESGSLTSVSGTQPQLTYWYLLKTSGGSNGPYYLKVDVVSEGGAPTVSQFSVVNFPVNGPPDSLK